MASAISDRDLMTDSHLDWWQALPSHPGVAQDAAIMAAHRDGIVMHSWAVVNLEPLQLIVSKKAPTVGHNRLRYSARLQQRAADWLDALLPTPAIIDAIWAEAAVQLAPAPLGDGHGGLAPDMAFVSAWMRHDMLIARQLEDRGGLMASEGKSWVLTPRLWERPERAANYGWIQRDGRPIQKVGLAHDPSHVDYSQLGCWVARGCVLRGDDADLGAVLRGEYGEDMARLVGGPMPDDRPPWAGLRTLPGGSEPSGACEPCPPTERAPTGHGTA